MTVLYAGLAVGSVYAIVACCYNVTLNLAGVVNFATAHMVVLGSFLAAWALADLQISLWLTIAICIAIGTTVGLIVELTAVAPLRTTKRLQAASGEDSHTELVTTVGASTVITGIAYLLWGHDPIKVPLLADEAHLMIFGRAVRGIDLLLVAVAVTVAVGLEIWSRNSRTGLASMAQIEDRDAAMLQGVNVRRLSLLGFGLAGGLGAALGIVVGAKTFAVVALALVLAIKGFVALVLGGVGNHMGALIGGLALGLAEMSTARWLGTDYRLLALFVVFIAVLVLRPQGLFGQKQGRVV